MAENTIGALIVFIVGAIPGFVFAYAIGVKKAVNLIAGWDSSKISNPTAYAQILGAGLLVLAINITAAALLLYGQFISENELALLIIVSSLIPVFCIIYARIKYGK